MPKYVGMGDEDVDESDEFTPEPTTRLVKSQGRQRDNARQQYILAFLEASGQSGATAKECVVEGQRVFDPEEYHGPVSGALSTMRKAGLVVMLRERRANYYVYVLPKYVGDSPVKELEDKDMFGRSKAQQAAEEVRRLTEENQALRVDKEHLSAALAQEVEAKDARDVQIDNLHADLESANRRAQDSERARIVAEKARQEATDAHYRTGALLETREQELSAQEERIADLAARLVDTENALAAAPSATPRKTLTTDERKTLAGVAKALEKYPTDGTTDAPVRITIKVGTLRTLGRALQRLTSD